MAKITFNNAPLGVLELGATYLTELAQAAQQLQNDPLAFLLPQKQVPSKRVEVQVKDGNLRVTGIVVPGMANGMNKWDRAKSFSYEPAYFRRGSFVDMDTVNYLSSLDSATKTYGMDLVQDQVQDLANQANMMLTVMRAQLLLGGINVTDFETGVSVQVSAGIPTDHEIEVGVDAPTAGSTKWADPAADIIDDLIKLKRMHYLRAQAEPDMMIVNGAFNELLLRNTNIKLRLEGQGAGDVFGFIKVEKGKIVELCGIKLLYCDTLYDADNANGTTTRKFIIPVEKAILLTSKHPMLPNNPLGYTVLAKGEHPNGGMGVWMRSWDHEALGGPQSAPGVGIQLGMSALPVLYSPKWIHILTIDAASAITDIVGTNYAS